MTFLQVALPLLVKRLCPWQHGNFNSTGAEVLEIFGVLGCPDSGQVRLAICSPRSWSQHVRFSVRRSRYPRGRIVDPLRRDWKERGEKNDQNRNRSRNSHVGLPWLKIETVAAVSNSFQVVSNPPDHSPVRYLAGGSMALLRNSAAASGDVMNLIRSRTTASFFETLRTATPKRPYSISSGGKGPR